MNEEYLKQTCHEDILFDRGETRPDQAYEHRFLYEELTVEKFDTWRGTANLPPQEFVGTSSPAAEAQALERRKQLLNAAATVGRCVRTGLVCAAAMSTGMPLNQIIRTSRTQTDGSSFSRRKFLGY